MSYLKYYDLENERHAEANSINVNFAMAITYTDVLCKYFHVPAISIKLFDKTDKQFRRMRKVQSWYSGETKPEIVYHPTMLTVLTVAHEVAHYVHDLRRGPKTWYRHGQKRHNIEHRLLTDEGVAFLMPYARVFL